MSNKWLGMPTAILHDLFAVEEGNRLWIVRASIVRRIRENKHGDSHDLVGLISAVSCPLVA